jgi:hypothetical protein
MMKVKNTQNHSFVVVVVVALIFSSCVAAGIQGAAQKGDLNTFKSMLAQDKTQLQKRYLWGQTLLHSAAESGNLDLVRYIVEQGVDVNAEADGGQRPIQCAVSYGHLEIVKYLVSRGADTQVKDEGGNSLLHIAAYHNNDPFLFKYLVSEGCDINERDNYGFSILHVSAQAGKVGLTKYLISKGVDISATDNSGLTAAATIRDYEEDNYKEIYSLLSSMSWKSDEAYSRNNAFESPSFSGNKVDVFSGEDLPNTIRRTNLDSAFNTNEKNNYAVIIGNNQYHSFPLLKTAINDAKAVESLLKTNYKFNCRLIFNGSRLDILQTFDDLRSALSPSDSLLIYYAGHGYYDQKADRGYWLPIDAQPNTTANWISNSDITDKLKAIDATHIMVVADSCYSGTLTRGVNVSIRDQDYFKHLVSLRSRTVLTSGGMEPVADSGGGQHSVFAKAFIDALEQNTGIMDGTELFTKIRRPVMLNSDQTPGYSDIRKAGHEGGDFLFVRKQ